MRLEIYHSTLKLQWDDFVRNSKNGTFLFLRDYMNYHRDRFADNSLLVFDGKEQLIALLPANKKDDELISHGGLTYGGFVTDERMKTEVMLKIFEQTLAYLKENNFAKLTYKCVPQIYHRFPADEDLYALFRYQAVLLRRDVASTISLSHKLNYQERRQRAIKKAVARKVICGVSTDYSSYWRILEENLTNLHETKPVHTLAEIEMLQRVFSDNIKLFAAFIDDQMVAGTIVYETSQVAHAQYIASSNQGRSTGALDSLFNFLLTEVYREKSFFDFGISTEDVGKFLNLGLIDFKEGFGGRAIVYDAYEITIS